MVRAEITLAHSPDADDAFMFWALARGRIDTGGLSFRHVLKDIQTLNRDAQQRVWDVTAVSINGYAHIWRDYALLSTGGSIGDGYGPRVIAKSPLRREDLRGKRIAHPGELTTAWLALRLWQPQCELLSVDFKDVGPAVKRGEADAGVIIHEGQLTWEREGFHLVEDLGSWWRRERGLPLPLGANAIRRSLGREAMREIATVLKRSIEAGLRHRDEALAYALQFGRGLSKADADEFVGMYVNAQTLEMPPDVRKSAQILLDEAFSHGLVPEAVHLEFVEPSASAPA
jgi:1,4-dihydroxy-6-naphthoate synthase